MRPLLLRTAFATLCAIGPAGALPAAAAGYVARDVAGWTVAASEDGQGCFLTRDYDRTGDTTLMLGLDTDGANRLSVLNAHWSVKPGERLKLTYRLSKGGYVAQPSVGMAADGKRGFVASFEGRFPTYFAASRGLAIFRGDIPVERLDLDGSGAAVAELRRCVAQVRAAPAAKRGGRERPDSIPKDPFARDAKRDSRK